MNEGNLTVSEVLDNPLFLEAEVIAGGNGLSRNIRWVHILESAENAPALNGKELILATGIEFGNDPQKLLKYLEQIIGRGASGLCLRLGPYVTSIPCEAIEMADGANFPLIVFRNPVRFVDITLNLHETIVNRHVLDLTKLDEYARNLQKLSLEGKHLSGILAHLQKTINEKVYFLTCDGFFLSVPSLRPLEQKNMINIFRPLFAQENNEQTHGFLRFKDQVLIYQPIRVMEQVLALLFVTCTRQDQDEFLVPLLDYTVSTIAQILLRGMIVQERSLDNEGGILEDILQGRLTGEDEIRTALGIENGLNPIYLTLMFEEINNSSGLYEELSPPYSSLLAVFRFIASHYGFRSIFLERKKKIYVLLISTIQLADWRGQISNAINRYKEVDSNSFEETFGGRYGIGRPARDFAEIRRAFQEAEQALNFYPIVNSPFYNDLGVFRLLAEVKNSYALQACVEDYLGPILKYDKEHGSELLLTLRKFLENNLAKKETADLLFIHRQTLYHRLDKIEELIGNYYDNPARRLCVELAFHIYDWLSKKEKC